VTVDDTDVNNDAQHDAGSPNTRKRIVIFVVIMFIVAIALAVGVKLLENNQSAQSSYGVDEVERVEINVGSGNVEVSTAVDAVTVEKNSTFHFREPSINEVVEDGILRIEQDCGSYLLGMCETDFTVTVPTDTALQLTTGNGDIEASQLRADVVAKSDGGDVEFSELFGLVDIETKSGNVALENMSSLNVLARTEDGSIDVDSQVVLTSVDTETTSGNIDLALNDESPYRVDARSASGRVVTDLSTNPGAPNTVRAISESGDVEVSAR
jgi:DUF4097 and DUF4098 domain-containing protein YvlB